MLAKDNASDASFNLLNQRDNSEALVEMYHLHLSYGAPPNMSFLFMTRLESLLNACDSNAVSSGYVMARLSRLESDFRGMGFFDGTLEWVRKELEGRMLLD